MTFQIHPLPYEPFAPLFAMTDKELRRRDARRMTVSAHPGTPCRAVRHDDGRQAAMRFEDGAVVETVWSQWEMA